MMLDSDISTNESPTFDLMTKPKLPAGQLVDLYCISRIFFVMNMLFDDAFM